jgi:hypothetical protein
MKYVQAYFSRPASEQGGGTERADEKPQAKYLDLNRVSPKHIVDPNVKLQIRKKCSFTGEAKKTFVSS